MTDPNDKTAAPAGPGARTNLPNSASTEIERDAKAGAENAKQAADTARQKASEFGERAKQTASDAAADAKRHARSFAEDQKNEAAGRVDGVADALRSAAGSLDEQNQPAVAGYARDAASGLEQVADAISNRSVDDLMETVEDFARRQPVAFLGGAVLTGFVLSRFAKSSAERRHGGVYKASARSYAPPPRYQSADVDARRPLESGGHGVGTRGGSERTTTKTVGGHAQPIPGNGGMS